MWEILVTRSLDQEAIKIMAHLSHPSKQIARL